MLYVGGPRFEETLEEKPIATGAASPEEPGVKALGVVYRTWEGERGRKGGQSGDVMPREGVRACGKKQIRLERQDHGRQYRDEGTEPR